MNIPYSYDGEYIRGYANTIVDMVEDGNLISLLRSDIEKYSVYKRVAFRMGYQLMCNNIEVYIKFSDDAYCRVWANSKLQINTSLEIDDLNFKNIHKYDFYVKEEE